MLTILGVGKVYEWKDNLLYQGGKRCYSQSKTYRVRNGRSILSFKE